MRLFIFVFLFLSISSICFAANISPINNPALEKEFGKSYAKVVSQYEKGKFAKALKALKKCAGDDKEKRAKLKSAAEHLQRRLLVIKWGGKAVKASRKPKVFLDLPSGIKKVAVSSVDDSGMKINIDGQDMPVKWSSLSPYRMYNLGLAFASPTSGKAALKMAKMAVGDGLMELAEEGLTLALERDKKLAKKIKAVRAEITEAAKVIAVAKAKEMEANAAARKIASAERSAARAAAEQKKREALSLSPTGWKAPNSKQSFRPRGLGSGGTYLGVTFNPDDPEVIFATTDMGSSFLTTNGGIDWSVLRIQGSAHGAAFIPKSKTLLVGSNGIFRSEDCGQTWEKVSKFPGGQFEVDAQNPNNVWVCFSPLRYVWIYKNSGMPIGMGYSTDAGKTWTKAHGIPEGVWAFDVAMVPNSPVDSRHIYAATSKGVYKSTDGGKNYVKISGLSSHVFRGVDCATDAKGKAQVVYVTENKNINGKEHDISVSKDGGKTWKTLPRPKRGEGFREIRCATKNPNLVYVGVYGSGVWQSKDGGQTWENGDIMKHTSFRKAKQKFGFSAYYAGGGGKSAEVIDICESNPNIIAASTWNYVLISKDAGKTWRTITSNFGKGGKPPAYYTGGGMVTNIYSVLFNPWDSNRVYRCTTDMGYNYSLDGGDTWLSARDPASSDWYAEANTNYDMEFHPTDKNKVFMLTSSKHDLPSNKMIDGLRTSEHSKSRFMVSTNKGITFTTVGNIPLKSILTDMVVDPINPNLIYVADFGFGIYKSVDGGKSFTLLTGSQKVGNNIYWWRLAMAGKKDKKRTLYGVMPAFASTSGGAFRSRDGGKTFEQLGKGKLANAFDVLTHPDIPGWVMVSTIAGVFLSTDYGNTFKQSYNPNAEKGKNGRLRLSRSYTDVNTIFVSGKKAAYTKDGGASWSPIIGIPQGRSQHVTDDPRDPNTVWVSSFGGGTYSGPLTGAIPWEYAF